MLTRVIDGSPTSMYHGVLIQTTSSCTGDRKLEASYISFVTRQKVLVASVRMFAHVACR